MFTRILKVESEYNALLPLQKLAQRPGDELIAAARRWSEEVWKEAVRMGALVLSDQDQSRGLQLLHHAVFICGAHRSGTTLVRDMLDGHPDLVVLPSEGTYYTNLEHRLLALDEQDQLSFLAKEWLRRLVNPINQPPYWLLGKSGEAYSPYIDFARYMISWWDILKAKKIASFPQLVVMLAYTSCTNNLNAKLWVEKTPTNERFIKRIRHDFPQAKIIHLVRNPRDTLASRKQTDPIYDLKNVLFDIRKSLSVALHQSSLQDDNYLLVRYEVLCERPQDHISVLTNFLNITGNESLSIPSVAGLPSTANSSFKENAMSGEIHKWNRTGNTKVLSQFEEQVLAISVGSLANKKGYALIKPGLLASVYVLSKYFVYLCRRSIRVRLSSDS